MGVDVCTAFYYGLDVASVVLQHDKDPISLCTQDSPNLILVRDTKLYSTDVHTCWQFFGDALYYTQHCTYAYSTGASAPDLVGDTYLILWSIRTRAVAPLSWHFSLEMHIGLTNNYPFFSPLYGAGRTKTSIDTNDVWQIHKRLSLFVLAGLPPPFTLDQKQSLLFIGTSNTTDVWIRSRCQRWHCP